MELLTRTTLRGNWATLLLPINEDDSIDFVRLAETIDIMIDAKPNGIYSNGTAGEFYNQTEQEFDQIHTLLAEKCQAADIPFQIGVSHMSPIICLERLKRSKQLKPGAFQIILPDWIQVSQKEIMVFLTRLAKEAEPIGLVLYNPPRSKRVLTPQDYEVLAREIKALVGIKVLDGDDKWYADMRGPGNDLSIFVPGHHLASGMTKGASGTYSNVACLSPVFSQKWYDLMKIDIDSALAIEEKIKSFMNNHIIPYRQKGYCDAALDKLLAAIGDWAPIGTRLRWPYQFIPEREANTLRSAVQDIPLLLN